MALLATLLTGFGKRRLAGFSALAGLGAVALSAAPFNTILFGVMAAAAAGVGLGRVPPAWRGRAGGMLAATALAMAVLEARHWPDPEPMTVKGRLILIGDSLSSGGLFPGEIPYPVLLGPRVVNRAVAGATTADALAQLKGVDVGRDDTILFEIGGNDLFNGQTVDGFRAALDHLLARGAGTGAKLVMLELPLWPRQRAFGQAQRELARRHGVTLIPKRHFASVLLGRDATTDGIHLSNAGHLRMADLMRRFLLGLQPEST